ncbi:MAG TPA: ATP12 family protein [Pseudolabrys sp.]|nr:ATP12 family protein [Pseudolabrys sp.]
MRDIFAEIFENGPRDPIEAARRASRPRLRKRFYQRAMAGEGGTVLLDGKPVMTPARKLLVAPTPALVRAIAAEWNAQQQEIDPGRMPLTRLANAAIDAVAAKPAPVAAEIEKYLGSDLLFYRAEGPAGLVAKQAQHWDPLIAWAREGLGARFVLAQGVMHVKQPGEAIAAARARIPVADSDAAIWRLAAMSSITSLTGSALLALALAARAIDVEAAWTAAHVDEDWQMAQWGEDELALATRAFRRAEMDAAAMVLALLR